MPTPDRPAWVDIVIMARFVDRCVGGRLSGPYSSYAGLLGEVTEPGYSKYRRNASYSDQGAGSTLLPPAARPIWLTQLSLPVWLETAAFLCGSPGADLVHCAAPVMRDAYPVTLWSAGSRRCQRTVVELSPRHRERRVPGSPTECAPPGAGPPCATPHRSSLPPVRKLRPQRFDPPFALRFPRPALLYCAGQFPFPSPLCRPIIHRRAPPDLVPVDPVMTTAA